MPVHRKAVSIIFVQPVFSSEPDKAKLVFEHTADRTLGKSAKGVQAGEFHFFLGPEVQNRSCGQEQQEKETKPFPYGRIGDEENGLQGWKHGFTGFGAHNSAGQKKQAVFGVQESFKGRKGVRNSRYAFFCIPSL